MNICFPATKNTLIYVLLQITKNEKFMNVKKEIALIALPKTAKKHTMNLKKWKPTT